MDIHEYQAKEILAQFGVPTPEFSVISSLDELKEAVAQMGLDQAVLKVQVHAGGRGKAGGVKLAKTHEEILNFGEQLLGMRIINNQTGKDGIVANQILISPLVKYKKEYYLGAIIDREKAQAMLILSPEGGMDIEEVAAKFPDKLMTVPIMLDGRLRSYQLTEMAKFMGWSGATAEKGKKVIAAVAKAFSKTDASLLEINPLVETDEGDIVALDAKLSIDDNALYRQPEIKAFYDPSQIPKNEAMARAHDLAYVSLDGNIGCMVNGAGLAMATMDIIQLYGGRPANFLDVGGGATEEKVAEGFKIILFDPNVKAILVNIFGGIMNCVTLAAGIIAAAGQLQIHVPLVVRLEGTNVEQGKKMLKDSGLRIIIADDLAQAAEKVVQACRS